MGGFVKFLGPLKAPFFQFLNGIIKSKMGKTAEDIARIIEEIAGLVVEQVLAEQATGAPGADKHKAVAARILATIAEKDGLDLPPWAMDFLREYLDDLITAAVEAAKGAGLFPR